MGYILKKQKAEVIRSKYKNSYFVNNLDLSNTYISLIVNRKQHIPKRVAIAFTNIIDKNASINDIFDEVK